MPPTSRTPPSLTSPDDEKLDVLIVHLTNESKLERARTAIRNFVADHLKQRDGKDAALVAFVSPTERQWRFSYVKMEYAAVETGSGKVGVETRLTPARRFSYIVGEGESCHTAPSRLRRSAPGQKGKATAGRTRSRSKPPRQRAIGPRTRRNDPPADGQHPAGNRVTNAPEGTGEAVLRVTCAGDYALPAARLLSGPGHKSGDVS